ncbi:adenine nucleotide alpha hydrolase family protein [Cellulomonas alba]|uniref:Universal stress protein n=1 Tax=Cellulomonas alba TaxID=3053467 RepID=A0ABT7SD63_9CELL|nr:universal stress protein [Cellulomonas alba]MDM7854118.1 universal stress protein [Cellulomonas alba]
MTRTRPHPWSLPAGTEPPARPVVVGVEPLQDPTIVLHAALLARRMGTGLACVWVDEAHVARTQPDGGLALTPVDPDHDEEPEGPAPEADLLRQLTGLLHDLPWRLVYVVGETTRGLTAVAAKYDAPFIAVGTRRPGFGGWMHEVVGGSVGGRLSHTQARPVLLLPHGGRT